MFLDNSKRQYNLVNRIWTKSLICNGFVCMILGKLAFLYKMVISYNSIVD